ncbi:MAG TPA: alternative ribosome rescue aminoacyl-tRNA hydrolase ArfB [Phycisphaerales bacterium]|nr:alternative ribosome rescue aminoacyl-tRNA hydrolase ArfB [Phycisphaerales bacterium]
MNTHDEQPAAGISVHGRLVVPAAAIDVSFISSGGPGGQNVNKRATKCVMRVFLHALLLEPAQTARLATNAKHLITDSGEIVIAADEYRSQERNRAACEERLADLINQAWNAPKVRKATKPSRRAKQRRLDEKKHEGERKKRRSNWDD